MTDVSDIHRFITFSASHLQIGGDSGRSKMLGNFEKCADEVLQKYNLKSNFAYCLPKINANLYYVNEGTEYLIS